jgi:hypothetical protein
VVPAVGEVTTTTGGVELNANDTADVVVAFPTESVAVALTLYECPDVSSAMFTPA